MITTLASAAIFILIAILVTILFGSYVIGPAVAMVAYIFSEMLMKSNIPDTLGISIELFVMLLYGVSTIFSYLILYEATLNKKKTGCTK